MWKLLPNDGSFVNVLQQSPEKIPEDECTSVGESEVGVQPQYGVRRAPHLRSLIVNKSCLMLWHARTLTSCLRSSSGVSVRSTSGGLGLYPESWSFSSRVTTSSFISSLMTLLRSSGVSCSEIWWMCLRSWSSVQRRGSYWQQIIKGPSASSTRLPLFTEAWNFNLGKSNGYKILSEINYYPRRLTSCYFGNLQMMSKTQNRWTPSKAFQWDLHTIFTIPPSLALFDVWTPQPQRHFSRAFVFSTFVLQSNNFLYG